MCLSTLRCIVVSGHRNVPDSTVKRIAGLRLVVSETMFDAIFHTIFGENYIDDEKMMSSSSFTAGKIYDSFEIFHKYFNYFWLGLPKWFFPTARRALQTLLAMPDSAGRSVV